MQAEIEKWIENHAIYSADQKAPVILLEDLEAMLAGKVLCASKSIAAINRSSGEVVATLDAAYFGTNWTPLYAPASPLGNADIGKPEPDYKALYNELLYQVATVVPGESRYQTALRYIREREDRCNAPEVGESADSGKEGGE
jgi:hypothetical protein